MAARALQVYRPSFPVWSPPLDVSRGFSGFGAVTESTPRKSSDVTLGNVDSALRLRGYSPVADAPTYKYKYDSKTSAIDAALDYVLPNSGYAARPASSVTIPQSKWEQIVASALAVAQTYYTTPA